jgi:hypothetical protein
MFCSMAVQLLSYMCQALCYTSCSVPKLSALQSVHLLTLRPCCQCCHTQHRCDASLLPSIQLCSAYLIVENGGGGGGGGGAGLLISR